jgi:hypothetical protein
MAKQNGLQLRSAVEKLGFGGCRSFALALGRFRACIIERVALIFPFKERLSLCGRRDKSPVTKYVSGAAIILAVPG